MSVSKEDDMPFSPELLSGIFEELVDCIIVDVASESHRIAKLGLDRHLDEEEEELRLSAEARARASHSTHGGEANGKNVVDIFGQAHSSVAGEIIQCMNCSRSVVAGRFAPHLEKCMGKGRKARLKSTRSTTAAQNQFSRSSPVSNTSRVGNGSGGNAGHEYSNGALEEQ